MKIYPISKEFGWVRGRWIDKVGHNSCSLAQTILKINHCRFTLEDEREQLVVHYGPQLREDGRIRFPSAMGMNITWRSSDSSYT